MANYNNFRHFNLMYLEDRNEFLKNLEQTRLRKLEQLNTELSFVLNKELWTHEQLRAHEDKMNIIIECDEFDGYFTEFDKKRIISLPHRYFINKV